MQWPRALDLLALLANPLLEVGPPLPLFLDFFQLELF